MPGLKHRWMDQTRRQINRRLRIEVCCVVKINNHYSPDDKKFNTVDVIMRDRVAKSDEYRFRKQVVVPPNYLGGHCMGATRSPRVGDVVLVLFYGDREAYIMGPAWSWAEYPVCRPTPYDIADKGGQWMEPFQDQWGDFPIQPYPSVKKPYCFRWFHGPITGSTGKGRDWAWLFDYCHMGDTTPSCKDCKDIDSICRSDNHGFKFYSTETESKVSHPERGEYFAPCGSYWMFESKCCGDCEECSEEKCCSELYTEGRGYWRIQGAKEIQDLKGHLTHHPLGSMDMHSATSDPADNTGVRCKVVASDDDTEDFAFEAIDFASGAYIRITKDGQVVVYSHPKITAKSDVEVCLQAPLITLDGDVTVTGSLTHGNGPCCNAIITLDGAEAIAEDLNGQVISHGTADVVLGAVANLGGDIILREGIFNVTQDIIFPANTYLHGAGESISVINFTDEGKIVLDGDHSGIENLSVTGKGYIKIMASHTRLENVEVVCQTLIDLNWDDPQPSVGAIWVAPEHGETLTDHVFINCYAHDCNVFGFENCSNEYKYDCDAHIENQTYINCRAERCGITSDRAHVWVTGFDLAEVIIDVKNITLIGCQANNNYESGFHMEGIPRKYDIKFIGCSANNNAVRPRTEVEYGAGFLVGEGTEMVGCSAKGNWRGLLLYSVDNVNPSNIECITEENEESSVLAFQVRNLVLNLYSTNDGEMGLGKNMFNCKINATIIGCTKMGWNSQILEADWGLQNSEINVNIVDPAGQWGSSNFINRVKNSKIKIHFTTTTKTDYSYIVLKSLEYCDVEITGYAPDNETGAMVLIGGTCPGTNIHGSIDGSAIGILSYNASGLSGDVMLHDLIIRRCQVGVDVGNVEDITLGSLIMDARTVPMSDVTIPVRDPGNKLTFFNGEHRDILNVVGGASDYIARVLATIPEGGVLTLLGPAYTINSDLTIPANITLKGSANTVITLGSEARIILLGHMEDLTITGNGWVEIGTSHHKIRRVTMSTTSYYDTVGAFYINCPDNTTIEDILFEDVIAQDCTTPGWYFSGAATPVGRTVQGIKFIRCQALRCGATSSRAHDWVDGFMFNGFINSLKDILMEDCIAADNWECGIDFKLTVPKENIVLKNCRAYNNGIVKSVPDVGAGIVSGDGCVLLGCRAYTNNIGIYHIGGDRDVPSELDVETSDNDLYGIYISSVIGLKANLLMRADAELGIGHNIVKSDIKAIINDAKALAWNSYTSGSNNCLDRCHVEIYANNPVGDWGCGFFANVADSTIFARLRCTAEITDCTYVVIKKTARSFINMDLYVPGKTTGILLEIGGVMDDTVISGKLQGGVVACSTYSSTTGISGSLQISNMLITNAATGIRIQNVSEVVQDAVILDKRSIEFGAGVDTKLSDAGAKAFIRSSAGQIIYRNCKAASATLVHAAIQNLSGTHTDVTNPDHPRCITVTQAGSGTPIAGTVTITGVLATGDKATENIAISAANGLYAGSKAFAKVTSIVGFDCGASQTLSVGINDVFGLPSPILSTGSVYKFQKAQTDQALPAVDVTNGTVNLATITNGNDCSIWFKA